MATSSNSEPRRPSSNSTARGWLLAAAYFTVTIGGQPRKVVAARFYGTSTVPEAASAAGEFQLSDLVVGVADEGRLQPLSHVTRGVPLAALLELMSSDPAKLEAARVTLEVLPGGTAQPVLRLLMAAKANEGGAVVLHQAAVDTARLAPGRYTVIATPVLGEKPLGRVSRLIQIDEK